MTAPTSKLELDSSNTASNHTDYVQTHQIVSDHNYTLLLQASKSQQHPFGLDSNYSVNICNDSNTDNINNSNQFSVVTVNHHDYALTASNNGEQQQQQQQQHSSQYFALVSETTFRPLNELDSNNSSGSDNNTHNDNDSSSTDEQYHGTDNKASNQL